MVQGAQGLVDKAWGLNFWTSIHLQGGLVASKWLAEDRQAPLALVQGRAHIQTQLLHAAEPLHIQHQTHKGMMAALSRSRRMVDQRQVFVRESFHHKRNSNHSFKFKRGWDATTGCS